MGGLARWTTLGRLGSRKIADSREGVLNQGAEFLRAKAALPDRMTIASSLEIGQVLAGEIEGRRFSQD